MAFDRVVRFEPGKVPSPENVGKVICDFLGEAAVDCHWAGGRFTATLVGNKSWPLRRVYDRSNECMRTLAAAMEEESVQERWFEVFVGDDHVGVITRRADELTGAVADRFAEILARRWRGTLEAP